MALQKYRSLGFDANVEVPVTIEDCQRLNWPIDRVIKAAVDNIVYRSVLAGVRATFADMLEKETGIPRPSEVVKDKDGKPKKDAQGNEVTQYTQSEEDYVKKTVKPALKLTDEAFAAKFQPLMDKAVNLTEEVEENGQKVIRLVNGFDPSEAVRTPRGPKNLAAIYKDTAARVFSNGNQQKAADRIKSESGTDVVFVDEVGTDEEKAALRQKNIEALGWAIKANEAWKAEQNRNEYV